MRRWNRKWKTGFGDLEEVGQGDRHLVGVEAEGLELGGEFREIRLVVGAGHLGEGEGEPGEGEEWGEDGGEGDAVHLMVAMVAPVAGEGRVDVVRDGPLRTPVVACTQEACYRWFSSVLNLFHLRFSRPKNCCCRIKWDLKLTVSELLGLDQLPQVGEVEAQLLRHAAALALAGRVSTLEIRTNMHI